MFAAELNPLPESVVMLLLLIALTFGGTSEAQLVLGGGPIAGGWSSAPVSDPGIVNASRISVLLYGQSINAGVALRVLKVLEAEQQVVSGTNYNLTVSLGYTNCQQSDEDKNPQCCRIDYNQVCTFKVYIQSWTNTKELTSSSCQTKTSVTDNSWVNPCTTSEDLPPTNGRPLPGRQLTGGWSNATVTDPEIQNSSRTAVLLYKQSINSDVALRLLCVLQAQTEIVSGKNYNLTVSIGYTNCKQAAEDTHPECCRIDYKQTCTFILYIQPWTDTKRLTSVSCQHKSPVNDISWASPCSSDVKNAASYASNQINNKLSKNRVTLVKIIKATQTVKKGSTRYTIDVEFKRSGASSLCTIFVLKTRNVYSYQPGCRCKPVSSFKC